MATIAAHRRRVEANEAGGLGQATVSRKESRSLAAGFRRLFWRTGLDVYWSNVLDDSGPGGPSYVDARADYQACLRARDPNLVLAEGWRGGSYN